MKTQLCLGDSVANPAFQGGCFFPIVLALQLQLWRGWGRAQDYRACRHAELDAPSPPLETNVLLFLATQAEAFHHKIGHKTVVITIILWRF